MPAAVRCKVTRTPIAPLFQDSSLQAAFERDGILQVPMLSAAEVETVRACFERHFPEPNEHIEHGFFTSVLWPEFEVKRDIDAALRELLLPKLERILHPFRSIVFALQSKGTGPRSELHLHQDWTVVDESRFRSATFWVPLVDSTADNGTIFFLSGDPDRFRNVRGGSIANPFLPIEADIRPHFSVRNVSAGEALFWDPAILHYSLPNLSGEPRISAVSTLVPDAASVQLYFRNPEKPGRLEVYGMPDGFYLRYADFFAQSAAQPEGRLLGDVEDRTPLTVDLDTFESILHRGDPGAA